MVQTINIAIVCLRCGKPTTFQLGLTHKEDQAIYKCELCNFIVCTSWITDETEHE